jgi:hypothetical protein
VIEIPKSSRRDQERAARAAGMTVEQWRDALADREVLSDRMVNRCAKCGRRHDPYMVSDALWSVHGVGDGELCLRCLESRLHRRVTVGDLMICGVTLEHPRLRRLVEAELRRYLARRDRRTQKRA